MICFSQGRGEQVLKAPSTNLEQNRPPDARREGGVVVPDWRTAVGGPVW